MAQQYPQLYSCTVHGNLLNCLLIVKLYALLDATSKTCVMTVNMVAMVAMSAKVNNMVTMTITVTVR